MTQMQELESLFITYSGTKWWNEQELFFIYIFI